MKKEFQIKCPAKINLTLDVVRRREDGYHDLEMIMQEINLHDILAFSVDTETDNPEIILTSEDPHMPTDESNLIYKAAKLFFDRTEVTASARIHCANKHMLRRESNRAGSSRDRYLPILQRLPHKF